MLSRSMFVFADEPRVALEREESVSLKQLSPEQSVSTQLPKRLSIISFESSELTQRVQQQEESQRKEEESHAGYES